MRLQSCKKVALVLALIVVTGATPGQLAAQPWYSWFDPILEWFGREPYSATWRCGDVEITELGPWTAYDRVIVDFGDLSVGDGGEYVFSACDVPRERLTPGLLVKLPDTDENSSDRRQLAQDSSLGEVFVAISIFDNAGQRLLHIEGALASEWWRWTGGLGYADPDYAFAYGSWSHVSSRPDPSFTPRRSSQYEVHVRVVPPTDLVDADVRLMARGGGWK